MEISGTIGNTCGREGSDGYRDWSLFFHSDPDCAHLVSSVTFVLHATFAPNDRPAVHNREDRGRTEYSIKRKGWGTFDTRIVVHTVSGESRAFSHELSFDRDGCVPKQVRFAVEGASSLPVTSPSSTATGTATAPAGSTSSSSRDSSAKGKSKGGKAEGGAVSDRKRMAGVPAREMHGFIGAHAGAHWAAPELVAECFDEARPGYTSRKAHEYEDSDAVLTEKCQLLAAMMRRARNVVAYTGAGISVASGINDYATKASKSVAKNDRPKLKSSFSARPTGLHRLLAALHKEENGHLLTHWIQQNHDGLPQKAGFPNSELNEIHGSWFDPSNPVVPMSGTLRSDLCDWLEEWVDAGDLVLALGTSLCGMNADRVLSDAAERAMRDWKRAKHGDPSEPLAGAGSLGGVIVSLQQTQYDAVSSLRIFARLEKFAVFLSRALSVPIPSPRANPPDGAVRVSVPRGTETGVPGEYLVPYDSNGKLAPIKDAGRRGLTYWDIRPGKKIRITSGPGKGFYGKIDGFNSSGHLRVITPCQREGSAQHGKGSTVYILGKWWIEDIVWGRAKRMPFVNA